MPPEKVAGATERLHILWNDEGGPVQSEFLDMPQGSTVQAVEKVLRERHPDATYWEIGFPDKV